MDKGLGQPRSAACEMGTRAAVPPACGRCPTVGAGGLLLNPCEAMARRRASSNQSVTGIVLTAVHDRIRYFAKSSFSFLAKPLVLGKSDPVALG